MTEQRPADDVSCPVIDFMRERTLRHDHIVRGTAADGMISAIAITARETVQEARNRHASSAVVTAALGRLMMAAQMMAASFKGEDELLTLEVRGDGPVGGLTVTANNRGQVKGFANHPHAWLPLNGKGKLDVGGAIGKGTLTVVRDLPGTMPYSSQTELVSGEIGDDLAAYFQLSDQVPTSVGVGVLVNADTGVRQAGGFIIQLMPGYEPFLVDELERRLGAVSSVTALLEQGHTPSSMLQTILGDLDFQELELCPAEFYCGCNEKRAGRATLALGEAEIRDMIAKGEEAEVHCHFCGATYHIAPEGLQALLEGGA